MRIATRSSDLALWQAHFVRDQLRAISPEVDVQIVHVSTVGDRDQVGQLQQFGGLGVFTREVQKAVLSGDADLAVHSLKDLPTTAVEGLTLGGIPQRGSMFDCLVFPVDAEEPAADISELQPQARIGTGSPRRQAQLRHHRPDLVLSGVRGNVATRLQKLDQGAFDALVLAEAGLTRLGLEHRIGIRLRPPILLPAVGQGALGIECRHDDTWMREQLQAITDVETRRSVDAERSLLAELQAGCHAPVGVCTQVEHGQLTMESVVLSTDGLTRLHTIQTADFSQSDGLGPRCAEDLRQQGADALIHPQSGPND
jgi:hydroxymethylbilane synthase